MRTFVWNVRVYWEDTDAGGVVYHARYLHFFERARTEWLRSLGVHQQQLAEKENRIFTITNMNIDFVRAARLDDELVVSVHSAHASGARMTFGQDMKRASDGHTIAQTHVTAACLRADQFKPTRIPGWVRAEINNA